MMLLRWNACSVTHEIIDVTLGTIHSASLSVKCEHPHQKLFMTIKSNKVDQAFLRLGAKEELDQKKNINNKVTKRGINRCQISCACVRA